MTPAAVGIVRSLLHDLASPLLAARMNADGLARAATLDADDRAAASETRAALFELTEALASLRDLCLAEAGDLECGGAHSDFGAASAQAAESLAADAADRGIRLEIDAAPRKLPLDAPRAARVLRVLIAETMDHAHARVRVRADRTGVIVDGDGLPPSAGNGIFEPAASVLEGERWNKTLRLTWARVVARACGGEIEVGQSDSGGVRFQWRFA